MEEKLNQLLESTRQTVIKAVLHDLKPWVKKPFEEYVDVDGRHPYILDDITCDLITMEVECLSEKFQEFLGIPMDEYDDNVATAELDFRYSVLDEVCRTEEYKHYQKERQNSGINEQEPLIFL